MLHYRRIQREDKVLDRITCNKCGNSWVSNDESQVTEIKNVYGYGSKKDGYLYISHICEECMDIFYATFRIPPQIVGTVAWGEDPPDPILYVAEPPEQPTEPS